jgi:hypothetical protein
MEETDENEEENPEESDDDYIDIETQRNQNISKVHVKPNEILQLRIQEVIGGPKSKEKAYIKFEQLVEMKSKENMSRKSSTQSMVDGNEIEDTKQVFEMIDVFDEPTDDYLETINGPNETKSGVSQRDQKIKKFEQIKKIHLKSLPQQIKD